jgi:hypothetical protein
MDIWPGVLRWMAFCLLNSFFFYFPSLHLISRLLGDFDPVQLPHKNIWSAGLLGSPTREFVIRRFSFFHLFTFTLLVLMV